MALTPLDLRVLSTATTAVTQDFTRGRTLAARDLGS